MSDREATKAWLIEREIFVLDDSSAVELVIWELPQALAGSTHRFKYRLAYVESEHCVIRFDNEAGKGDHKHVGAREYAYRFVDLDTLRADFWLEVDRWRRE